LCDTRLDPDYSITRSHKQGNLKGIYHPRTDVRLRKFPILRRT